MKLGDYERADCNLYLLPPIDLSEVKSALEVVLLDSWRNGVSADQAVDQILNDRTILGRLAEKIAPNLNFQATQAKEEIKAQAEATIAAYGQRIEAQRQEIQSNLGAEEITRLNAAETAKNDLQQQTVAYSAAQARLEELRTRVKQRLDAIGGTKSYETLLTINERINNTAVPTAETEVADQAISATTTAPTAFNTTAPSYNAPQQNEAAPATTAVATTASEPSLEVVVNQTTAPTNSKTRRAFRKIWKVLNYRLTPW